MIPKCNWLLNYSYEYLIPETTKVVTQTSCPPQGGHLKLASVLLDQSTVLEGHQLGGHQTDQVYVQLVALDVTAATELLLELGWRQNLSYYNSMNTNEYWYRTLSLFKLEKHDGFQSLSCAWSASIRGLHLHLYSPGDTTQPCLTPRSILNHSVSPLLVRTTDSCSLYRFANSLARCQGGVPRRSDRWSDDHDDRPHQPQHRSNSCGGPLSISWSWHQ